MLLAVGLLVLIGLVIATATDHGRLQLARLQDAVSLTRMNEEKTQLERVNDLLRVEVAGLKGRTSRAREYEESLKRHLEQLSVVVSTAASLGLVDDEPLEGEPLGGPLDETAPPTVKGKGGEGTSKGGVLQAKNRSSKGGKADMARAKPAPKALAKVSSKDSIGGAEIDCRGHTCPALQPVPVPGTPREVVLPDQRLIAMVERYLRILRRLPLGVPANGRISSPYGYRESPFGNGGVKLHEGIDVALPIGSKVTSTAEGVVEAVVTDPTYGLRVDIRHSSGVVTRYGHLAAALVATGDAVVRGQPIALSGSTGRSTGPHLHYEVRVRGEASDPIVFVRLAQYLERMID
jgi:murein DD-endopeptidase MepM/ murein hydrolase activator NlpD